MMERKFILSDVLRVAWKGFMAQIWLLSGLIIGYTIISLAMAIFIPNPVQGSISLAGMTMILLIVVFSLLFSLGYTKNLFQAFDGEEPQFSAYGQQAFKIITWFIAGLIYAVVVIIGLALLIVPGIYLAIRLQFFYASIVEEDTGIVDSLKRSWVITHGQVMPLFWLLLVTKGLILLGLAFFVIGVFVTFPLAGMMYCNVFRKLTIF